MVTHETLNLMQYIPLCLWIKSKSLLSVEHNYCSLFWCSYMFRSFSTIIGLTLQYSKVTLKILDKYVQNVGSYKFTKTIKYKIYKIVKKLL